MTLCNKLKKSFFFFFFFLHCPLFCIQLTNVFHLQFTNITSAKSVTFYILTTIPRQTAIFNVFSCSYAFMGQHTWWLSCIISSLQSNDVTLTYAFHSAAKLADKCTVPLCMEEKAILSCHVLSFHHRQQHYVSFYVPTHWPAALARELKNFCIE